MNLVTRAKRGKSKRAEALGRPRFIALTDPLRAPDPHAMLARLPRGSALIWRAYDKNPSRAELADICRLAHQRQITLLVATADRGPGLVAVGEHLASFKLKTPHTDGKFFPARRRTGAQFVTAAAHGEADIMAAARAGVDAVLISPVFVTTSHIGARPLGVTRFARLATLARAQGLAVYALGGVTDEGQMRRLGGCKLSGFAGIGFFKP